MILCREKSRITLSIKQLEEDPLLETLDKVIPQVCETLLYAYNQPFSTTRISQLSFSYTIIINRMALLNLILSDLEVTATLYHFLDLKQYLKSYCRKMGMRMLLFLASDIEGHF